jgi:hypothetical protein
MGKALKIREELSAEALRREARREKDGRAAARMYAIAHALNGLGWAEAARLAGMERQALRDAVVRCNAEGLTGLHDRPRGRPRRRLDRPVQDRGDPPARPMAQPRGDGVRHARGGIVGVDDTIERRWGKTSGLRWLSFMVPAPVPWAARVEALPVLTLLAPRARRRESRSRAQAPHRPGTPGYHARARRDHRDLRALLAGRGGLLGAPGQPLRRDPAPVVGPSHQPHHAHAHGTLQAHRALGRGSAPPWRRPLRRGLVPQGRLHLHDAIAAVRRRICIGDIDDTCPHDRDMPRIPPHRLIRMADAPCFTA